MGAPKLRKVYIAFTGGTIGMVLDSQGHANKEGFFSNYIINNEVIGKWMKENKVRIYVNEYFPLIDSSNVEPNRWWEILRDIKRQYKKYDGFIVVHGTDTLAYTSSILSFLIEETNKPIVVTGSQRPIYQKESDGISNMLNSIKVASGEFNIKEVCVVFGSFIMRGSRVTKVSALNDDAFASPQLSNLAKIDSNNITPNLSVIKKINSTSFKFSDIELTRVQVAVIKIFPGFIAKQIGEIIKANIKGIVIEAYGLGTAPNDPELINQLTQLKKHEITVVVVSQPIHGYVKLSEYESSSVFRTAGAISGYDMTTEAAVTKLYYLINSGLNYGEIKRKMRNSLRGELSKKPSKHNFRILT